MAEEARGPQPSVASVLARVRLLALDVDGVLTGGHVVLGEAGEIQVFDVRDGLGVKWLLRSDVQVAWISGRGCAATRRRAAELGVRELALGSGPKDRALAELQARLGLAPEATAAMGDDLPDLAMRSRCALFAAPSDAREEVRSRADLVTRASGGAGAVRELAELVLRAQGRWQAIVDAHGE